jgi:hypothetical protein
MSSESRLPSAESIPAEDRQQVDTSERAKTGASALSAPRWNWQDALYLFLLLLLVVIMAYRYTPNLTGEVAGEWWDPLLNMWTLSWDTTTLLHAPAHLWQGQLLYPNPLTLSYSENLLGEAIFYAPFFLITHNPVLAYNMTFYLTFLLCGVNMYIVARYYTGKPLAAFIAALIYAFAPYRLSQIDHIHVLAGEWIPLAFLCLDLSLQQNRWRHWSLFALFYLLQLLSSIYYGIFLTYALFAYVLIRYLRPLLRQLRQSQYSRVTGADKSAVGAINRPLRREVHQPGREEGLAPTSDRTTGVEHPLWGRGNRFIEHVVAPTLGEALTQPSRRRYEYLKYLMSRAVKPVVVFGVMLAILGALMAPYLSSLHNGLGRSIDQVWRYSAFVRDFGFAPPFNWLYGINSYNGVILAFDSEHYLFLGLATIALTVLGIVVAFRQRNSIMRAYTWTGLIVLLFAFGPFLQFSTSSGAPYFAAQPYPGPFPPGWPMPWLLAYYVLPGFTGLRVPARLIGILLMMLAVLAAYGIARLQEIYWGSRNGQPRELAVARVNVSWRRIAISSLLILIPFAILLEAMPAYLPVTQVPTGNQIPAVYQWLATHGNEAPIVELPIASEDRNFIVKYEAWYDYYAIYHPHPIMNGWSGLRPTLTAEIAAELSDFPAPDSLSILRQYHIQYVVLHLQFYRSDSVADLLTKVEASPGLQRVADFGSDSVWQVTNI